MDIQVSSLDSPSILTLIASQGKAPRRQFTDSSLRPKLATHLLTKLARDVSPHLRYHC